MTESKSSDARIDAIIADYLKAVAASSSPDRAALLAQHADLADELKSFFADHDRMHRFVEPPTIGPAPVESAPLGRVRYFGDYELLEEIARGGMGVVYKARQVSLNRVVALKMILAGQLASADDVRRFRTEAEAAANLDHPNILPIYEVGEHEGQHYFSMKYVEGGTLAGWWKKDGTVEKKPSASSSAKSAKSAVPILIAVARAVHYAHQRGILHRDLKPGNILLDADGTPFVADFGLAKRIEGDSNLTQSGAIVGTPSYMAPEQARGEKAISILADVYSLGAILYECLTSRPPFRAATPLETVLQVIEIEPESPSRVASNVDRDLEAVCLKCLEKVPTRRYRSAQDLAEDIDSWIRGEAVSARPISRFARFGRWCLVHPFAATSYLFTAAILVAFAVCGWWIGVSLTTIASTVIPIFLLLPISLLSSRAIDMRRKAQNRFAIRETLTDSPAESERAYVAKSKLELWMTRGGFAAFAAYMITGEVIPWIVSGQIPSSMVVVWPGILYWLAGSGLAAAMAAGLIKLSAR